MNVCFLDESMMLQSINLDELKKYNREFGQRFHSNIAYLSRFKEGLNDDGAGTVLLDGKTKGKWFHLDRLFCVLHSENFMHKHERVVSNTITIYYVLKGAEDRPNNTLRSEHMEFRVLDPSDKAEVKASVNGAVRMFKKLSRIKDEERIIRIFKGWDKE